MQSPKRVIRKSKPVMARKHTYEEKLRGSKKHNYDDKPTGESREILQKK